MTPGERICLMRNANGLTQQRLSDLIHNSVSVSEIQSYENNKKPVPAMALSVLANALNVAEFDLINGGPSVDARTGPDPDLLKTAKLFENHCGLNAYAALCAIETCTIVPNPDITDPGKTRFVPPITASINHWNNWRVTQIMIRFLACFSSLTANWPSVQTIQSSLTRPALTSPCFAQTVETARQMQFDTANEKNRRNSVWLRLAQFYEAYIRISLSEHMSCKDVENKLEFLQKL